MQVQKRKTYLARSMLHLKSRRVLPMLISRGETPAQSDKPMQDQDQDNKENEVVLG